MPRMGSTVIKEIRRTKGETDFLGLLAGDAKSGVLWVPDNVS